jgi:hypothetical protein
VSHFLGFQSRGNRLRSRLFQLGVLNRTEENVDGEDVVQDVDGNMSEACLIGFD